MVKLREPASLLLRPIAISSFDLCTLFVEHEKA